MNNKVDRRVSIRFPGPKPFSIIEALLEVEEKHFWPVHVVNLSPDGALLEMSQRKRSLLSLGQSVDVKLNYQKQTVWMSGVIQHIQSDPMNQASLIQVGVLFQQNDSKRTGPILLQMVRALDRYNLRRRTNLAAQLSKEE